MKKKAMISQPMAEKPEEEITATRKRAVKFLESLGYEVVNTLFTDDWYNAENLQNNGVVNIPLHFLAKSLEHMSMCHIVYFCKGWETARGCILEHKAAELYGVQMLYEVTD